MNILNDKIKIDRLPIFLCGPAYRGDDSDRRLILKNKLLELYDGVGKPDILPLIVDNYLSRKNRMDFSLYNVQLMEEICAAISFQTHLFLDSMSTATELGIFVNSAFNNQVYVYLPKQLDVFNVFNSGDFVREIILKNPSGNVKCIEYHPKVFTLAISSLCNHDSYEFNNDCLPYSIEKELLECSTEKIDTDFYIEYEETAGFSSGFNTINYTCSHDTLEIAISIKLLFYICLSLIGLYYPNITTETNPDINQLCKDIEELLMNSILMNSSIKRSDFNTVNIKTVLKYETEIIIRHIVAFLYFYKKGEGESRSSKYFLTKEKYIISTISDVGISPFEAFGINKKQLEEAQFLLEQTSPFEEYIVTNKTKKRTITKYSGNEGVVLKKYHNIINSSVRKVYKRTEYSYAYHEKVSALDCLNKHIESKGFIKFDIKNFFGSIDFNILAKSLLKELKIRENSLPLLIDILKTSCVNEKLPLGLVLSPIFSDIYLHDFDEALGDFCDGKYIYTRYADDIMISSPNIFTEEELRDIRAFVIQQLKRKKLNINPQKTKAVNFDYDNAFIKYVGVSIVKTDDKNILTVGKKYTYKLGDDFNRYLNDKEKYDNSLIDGFDNPVTKGDLFYTRLSLIGKYNYLLMIEGDYGKRRLLGRLKKHGRGASDLELERLV